MADLTADQAIEKLRTLPEDKQRQVLTALSPDERKGILTKLQGAPAGTKKKSTSYSSEAVSAIGRLMGALGSIPKQLLTPHETFGATREEEVKMGPTGRLLYNIPADILQSLEQAEAARQTAQRQGEGKAGQLLSYLENSLLGSITKKAEEAGPGRAKFTPETLGATVEGVGLIEGPRAAGEVISRGAKFRAGQRGAVRPTEVGLAEEKVPVLRGEAEPETKGGRLQAELKRAGAGEKHFKKFAKEQQESVKQVIRNTAKQTSGLIGPMQDEPGAAVQDAADVTFAKARPMYEALDKSLVTVPDDLRNVSAVVQQAIAKARKLGVEFEESPGLKVADQTAQNLGYKNFEEMQQREPARVRQMLPKDVIEAAT